MQNFAIKQNKGESIQFGNNDLIPAPMGCRNSAGIDGHALALVLANADIIIELSESVCALRVSREIATKLAFQGSWDSGVKALCDIIIIWDDNRCAVINVLKAANGHHLSSGLIN